MTIVFQVVAVVALIVGGFLFLRRGGARQQALRRVLMFLFIVAAASSVFFPQAWTWVANLLGIGRGADLLLYLLVLVFFGYVANTVRKFRQQEQANTDLAREIALLSARLETKSGEDSQ